MSTTDNETEMKQINVGVDIDNYRKLVQTYLNIHLYEAALFWADKVVALTNNNPKDVYWLAQCMFMLKQYHRAAHLLRIRNLDKTYILCNNLAVRCLLETNEYTEALKIINSIDLDVFLQNATSSTPYNSSLESGMFDDTPRNQVQSSVLLLKGKVLESMDNRGLASDCYRQALICDVHCYEAFECLIQHNMLTASEEQELIDSLPISEQCNKEEADILLLLYKSKLKKYHTPQKLLVNELDVDDVLIGPSTPNPLGIDDNTTASAITHKLHNSLDLIVAKAEQMYYNCDYQQCIKSTESILKQDPYHSSCLPIYISCLVELKQSNKLFSLAHNLVDLYPNLAISWFAVGCYYYIIGKSDFARRYLAKATTLDRLFGPAWLAYGHSFAVENEHDQAMAAYFKASQLMKGCHLPLMYIGLECGLTNNIRLAEKFFQQAFKIASDDPFVLHEMGVIAFQNLDYDTAVGHFKQALNIIKNCKNTLIPERWAPLYNNLGHALRKQKKYEEALQNHHEALILMPQSASIYSSIAFVHALMNQLEDAVEWFHKALGLRRDDTFSTTMLNYVIEQLADEQSPFPDAPNHIPEFHELFDNAAQPQDVDADATTDEQEEQSNNTTTNTTATTATTTTTTKNENITNPNTTTNTTTDDMSLEMDISGADYLIN